MTLYHAVNKSIADFVIFNKGTDFLRMISLIRYYGMKKPHCSFSLFVKKQKIGEGYNFDPASQCIGRGVLVNVAAYCIMPTHFHILLGAHEMSNISTFINNVLNGYTRYFNIKYNRKGPLWQGRTKKVLVKTDEQFLHLTRYIHLNPVTAYLIEKPEDWIYSSYKDYISFDKNSDMCHYRRRLIDIAPEPYQKFVNDRISYQRELAKIKTLTLE